MLQVCSVYEMEIVLKDYLIHYDLYLIALICILIVAMYYKLRVKIHLYFLVYFVVK